MKNLLLVLMCVIGFNTYAQIDSLAVSQENITEAERIIDKYGGGAVNAFKESVEKLTPLAEQSFNMVVKLQIAKGIGMLLPAFLIIILAICMPFIYKKSEWTNRGDPDNGMAIFQIITWVFTGILVIVSFFTVYSGILHLIAPEWFAVQEIFNLVK